MSITVAIRNVYGNELIYPICDTAHLLARLTGRKTFSHADIATIKKLGYEPVVQGATL